MFRYRSFVLALPCAYAGEEEKTAYCWICTTTVVIVVVVRMITGPAYAQKIAKFASTTMCCCMFSPAVQTNVALRLRGCRLLRPWSLEPGAWSLLYQFWTPLQCLLFDVAKTNYRARCQRIHARSARDPRSCRTRSATGRSRSRRVT